jgi:hypothetical protein
MSFLPYWDDPTEKKQIVPEPEEEIEQKKKISQTKEKFYLKTSGA